MKTKIVVIVILASVILISCAPSIENISQETTASPTAIPSKENIILDVALSPDGSKFAIYANTGVYIYDSATLNETIFRDFSNLDYGKYKGKEPSGAIAFSSDGNTIAISGKYPDTPVDLWDLVTGKYLMSITDIPPAYRVTKIQFSPDNKSMFIRSNYDWSMRCEQADANFALHTLDLSSSPMAVKVFSTDICQMIPMGFIRFIDNKFEVFVQTMGPKYSITTVDISSTTTPQEIAYENLDELYDVSPDGKIYAFISSQGNSRVTKLIDAATSKVLRTIPYRVKLLDDTNRFLVRDFFLLDDEWGLWENERIKCNFAEFTIPKFDAELAGNGESFVTVSPNNNVIIWNVSNCSKRNVLHFSK